MEIVLDPFRLGSCRDGDDILVQMPSDEHRTWIDIVLCSNPGQWLVQRSALCVSKRSKAEKALDGDSLLLQPRDVPTGSL